LDFTIKRNVGASRSAVLLREAGAKNQVGEARVRAEIVEHRVHIEIHYERRFLGISLFEPVECFGY
jgi:hypothetical protein